MAKKWLDSIEKQKRRINVRDKQTDGQTDRQSQRQKIIDSYRLGAEINKLTFNYKHRTYSNAW